MGTQFDVTQQLRPPDATKGDILVNDGSKWTPLAPGSDGEVLTADSGESTGLNWGTGSGLGDPGGNGIVVRTSINTTINRTIVAGSSKLAVTNGDGVSGNPSIYVSEADLTLDNLGGTLSISKGGTGQTAKTAAFDALAPTTTKGDILVDDGTNVVRLPVGTNGQVLAAASGETTGLEWTAAGAGEANTASNVGTAGVGVFKQKSLVDLEFKKINAGSNKITITDDTGDDEIDIEVVEANLTLDNIGGTLAISKGGTGQTAKTAAFDALAPTTTKGDVVVHDGTDNIRKAVGSDGQALVANSGSSDGLAWQTLTGTVPGGTQGQKLSFGEGNVISSRDWMVLAEDYGAIGDGATDDTAAILDAINSIKGTKKTLWASKSYKITSNVSSAYGDFTIDGGGTFICAAGASGSVAALLLFGQLDTGTQTTISETVSEGSRQTSVLQSFTVADSAGFAVGDLIKIDYNGTRSFDQLTRIRNIATNEITTDDPIVIPIDNGVTTMTKIIPVENVTIKNVRFLSQSDAAATSTRGLWAQYISECTFENLRFNDFNDGSGIILSDGYNVHVSDIYSNNCGAPSPGESGQFYINMSNSHYRNLTSENDSGFGPQVTHNVFSQVNGVTSTNAQGRGFKFAANAYTNVSNVTSSRALLTGVSLTDGTYRCQMDNVVVVGSLDDDGPSGSSGVWFSDQENIYNVLNNVTLQGNTTKDLFFGASDQHNTITNLNKSATLTNTGVINTIVYVGGHALQTVFSTLSNGENNNVDTSAGDWLRISGPTAAFQVTGLTGGYAGRIVTIYNTTTQDMTLEHNEATSTAGNRFELARNGADITLTGVSSATFVYDATSTVWRLLGVSGESV